MAGPIDIFRSGKIKGLKNEGPVYAWEEGRASLFLDEISFGSALGGILCYYNPPVHQVGNPGLDAYHGALDMVFEKKINNWSFLIFYGGCDPVHAGGDLKESLNRLTETIEKRKELEKTGRPQEEIETLYEWGDKRIEKGVGLYKKVRQISQHMRTVAICGGGTRFGGSAEITLMTDILIGDSRSGMCFSEAQIGLIPGWAGVGRTYTKAGYLNARFMASTSREVKAPELKACGIYNTVVEVGLAFPRKERTDDPVKDKVRYAEALKAHNDEVGVMLVPVALDLATCPKHQIPVLTGKDRKVLATEREIGEEVSRRVNPMNYEGLWGKPLKEVRDEIKKLGRPLAPQSIRELERLFTTYPEPKFEEGKFVEDEKQADSRLYRDPRFKLGIIATLEQKVADFREVKE
jgi:enoyl-CoA hydratase/carnithine racemase